MKINFVNANNNTSELLEGRVICPPIQCSDDFIDCVGKHCPMFIFRDEKAREGGCAFAVIGTMLGGICDRPER